MTDRTRLERASWLRPTVRVRLTLLYGGMFLLAGSLLLLLFYLVVENSVPGGGRARELLPQFQGDDAADGAAGAALAQREEAVRRALAEQRSEAVSSALRLSLLSFGLVATLAVGFGWMMAGRVLRPLQRITETARRVADRSLHERIALRGPRDELKELADTFDAMLERLDHAFDGQRRFVANASHELRTPLAINRTLLEVALTHADMSAELRQLVATLLGTNERSERLLDGLLALARSENQVLVHRPVDLSDVAAHAVEQTAHEAWAAGVSVDATPDPAPTAGEPALLERLALNLVQNGIRHNHRGGRVTVATGPAESADSTDRPGWVKLVVTNTGPVVPPYDVEDLFEPFRRGHRPRPGEGTDDAGTAGENGVGLGLSIVRSVARTHGGDVRAVPRSGGGLVVRVSLPGAPAALRAGEH
jgi:signal transduction histidine kinase